MVAAARAIAGDNGIIEAQTLKQQKKKRLPLSGVNNLDGDDDNKGTEKKIIIRNRNKVHALLLFHQIKSSTS